MLRERELKNGCALRLSVLEDFAGNPSIRKKKCPVTLCIPARRGGPYCCLQLNATLAST
jgi:hypothetical protein